MGYIKIASLIAFSLAIVGCDSSRNDEGNCESVDQMKNLWDRNSARVGILDQQVERRLESMKATIISLENELKEFRKNDVSLRLEVSNIKAATMPSPVRFNLKEKGGQQIVNAHCGSFMVAVKEVLPYLDCYKVVFSIGNPYAVVFENPKIKLSWFISYDKYVKNCEDLGIETSIQGWIDSKKEKEYAIIKQLKAGTWNYIEVILNASVDELEDIYFSFESINSVIMNTIQ